MDRESDDRASGAPDAAPFREIVEQYQKKVFRLVVSVLGPYSDADAEDVTQDVFVRAYRKFGQFRGDASVGTWLYRIARNQALNRKRGARFRLPHLQIDSVGREMVSEADDALLYEERERLARCMEKLPDRYRTAFYMHYWMGSTVEEIAEALETAPGTIKSYLSRGRDRIRSCLEKQEERR
jgi:RNA polymerase sigma-70 factor (ECF subfamily)